MVLTMGESLVAVVPTTPVRLSEVDTFRLFVGGAEVNFAVGIARLGLPTSWVGRVGDDPFGRLVRHRLAGAGVDLRWVKVDPMSPTGVYFREWLADGRRRPYYYRSGAAGSQVRPSDWPAAEVEDARWVHVTGIMSALSASAREATRAAIRWANEHGVPVSFDPNYREALWSKEEARSELRRLVAQAHVALMSVEDAALIFGTRDPDTAIERAHDAGAEVVVVKLGEHGAVASEGKRPIYREAVKADRVVDPVGAGDAFDAGFVGAMVRTGNLGHALDLANCFGGYAVRFLGEHAFPEVRSIAADFPDVVGEPSDTERMSGRGEEALS